MSKRVAVDELDADTDSHRRRRITGLKIQQDSIRYAITVLRTKLDDLESHIASIEQLYKTRNDDDAAAPVPDAQPLVATVPLDDD
jgi:hypothetical protein